MKTRLLAILLALALLAAMLPAALAEDAQAPFTVLSDGTAISVTVSCQKDGYTAITGYEKNEAGQYDPIEQPVDCYTVVLPAGIDSLELDFGETECIAYAYDKNSVYVASCGDYGDGTKGSTTAKVEDTANVIWVQTPYDENWNSDFLYAVMFTVSEGSETSQKKPAGKTDSADLTALLTNIGTAYASGSVSVNEWAAIDLAAAQRALGSDQLLIGDTARHDVLKAAAADEGSAASLDKAILALLAVGADPTCLKTGLTETRDLVSEMNAAEQSVSAWSAPFSLAVWNSIDSDADTEAQENALISSILDSQNADGSWTEYGDSVQTTSSMLTGLAFYYDSNLRVQAAVDRAVSYLASVQLDNGGFDAYGSGEDANTDAMVILGLCAVGVDPAQNTRFIKNGTTVVDALMKFAAEDASGFGYMDTAYNAYATEQAFRALVAFCAVQKTGSAFNALDLSGSTVTQQSAYGWFQDVRGLWSENVVGEAVQKGLMTGISDTEFQPSATMTRAMVATVLYRMAGSPEVTEASGFTDVEEGRWYSNAVAWAKAAGIVNGRTETTFAPKSNVTRQEMAVMLCRYAEYAGVEIDSGAMGIAGYQDAGQIYPYAYSAFQWCVLNKIISGYADGTLQPRRTLSRAEGAKMLVCLAELF